MTRFWQQKTSKSEYMMWKRCMLSIQNGIDNNIGITKIKPDSASLNN